MPFVLIFSVNLTTIFHFSRTSSSLSPDVQFIPYSLCLCSVGIIWKDSHEFLSGGKDSRLVLHSFRDAVRICEKVNPIAISSNRGDQLVLAVNEKLQSSSTTLAGMSCIHSQTHATVDVLHLCEESTRVCQSRRFESVVCRVG